MAYDLVLLKRSGADTCRPENKGHMLPSRKVRGLVFIQMLLPRMRAVCRVAYAVHHYHPPHTDAASDLTTTVQLVIIPSPMTKPPPPPPRQLRLRHQSWRRRRRRRHPGGFS